MLFEGVRSLVSIANKDVPALEHFLIAVLGGQALARRTCCIESAATVHCSAKSLPRSMHPAMVRCVACAASRCLLRLTSTSGPLT
ncbi:GPI-anchored surface protein, putative [Bodo saltans]|uniref:GPI-anchored surface protein, putative n=1 Tax=Bodo saltans TaxID=75058 RepID=A0A0S4J091_BODSA|nr:GPI-anchored surface protein, putative [Bodo saltans]|eukprot:CUG74671.1 GPI-anchored surface protein, putative [Bodo saltans]